MADSYHPFLPISNAEIYRDSFNASGDESSNRRSASRPLILICAALIALVLYAAVITKNGSVTSLGSVESQSRGTAEGVSEKNFKLNGMAGPYPWSNEMLSWQKTGFHFQPNKNWMNDPNGPLLYKGWYHFFYQYNPDGAVWGNIVWGHAVSRDLINWIHLPPAMVPDRWFDVNGVWTGSATLLPNGELIMLYTGSTNASVQVQNVAIPSDPSDPLLLNWVKKANNPVLYPPRGIDDKDFRDPTTAWENPDKGTWRIAIGSKMNTTGVALVYETVDFEKYELAEGVLHSVAETGMWECVDFFPVSLISINGVDTTSLGSEEVKVVLKASLDDDKNDYYALGRYFNGNNSWVPDDVNHDVGIGLKYDYGMFYASKTFYDEDKDRRVLWGWVKETDSEFADVEKGWASVQAIPRTLVLDQKTGSNLLQWPVEEVESLRTRSMDFNHLVLRPGTVVPIDVGEAVQLDILAEFELDRNATEILSTAVEDGYSCSGGGGAARRGVLGPFGLLVLADKSLSEMTPIYFYVTKGSDGNLKTFFCADESRSSKAGDVDKQIYGSSVPVLEDEKLSMRILVDHSIVESFGQGGRTCITSRVYPTKAIKEAARVFLFNNAANTTITCTIKVWEMGSASMRSYLPRMQF